MKFISHRGNDNHKYKENTSEAINDVLNKNYIDGVEIDIRITKDNKIILYHDMTISSIKKGIKYIKNTKYRDILKINKQIPLLKNILKKIDSSKIILLEIKEESKNFKKTIYEINKILKKFNHLNIYVFSFNYELMRYFTLINNTTKKGIIIGYLFNYNKCDRFDFCAYHHSILEDIKKETVVYTVNSKRILNKIKKIDSNCYIVTDKAYELKD